MHRPVAYADADAGREVRCPACLAVCQVPGEAPAAAPARLDDYWGRQKRADPSPRLGTGWADAARGLGLVRVGLYVGLGLTVVGGPVAIASVLNPLDFDGAATAMVWINGLGSLFSLVCLAVGRGRIAEAPRQSVRGIAKGAFWTTVAGASE